MAQWFYNVNVAEMFKTTKEKEVRRDMIANTAKHSTT